MAFTRSDYPNLKLPFSSGVRVTQAFGEDPTYYSQFGLKGHEGVDLVPITSKNKDILAVEDGVVVRDTDDPRSGAYGIYNVIWNEENKRGWWYCHESLNNLKLGQFVKKGDRLGVMGGTGIVKILGVFKSSVTGDHLHLGVRLTDEKANAINLDNGFKGFVDPSDFLAPDSGIFFTDERTVKVRPEVHTLFVRSGAARTYPLNGSKELHANDEVEVVGFVIGEELEDKNLKTPEGDIVKTNLWYKTKFGNYIWSGGTDRIPELPATPSLKEVNSKMTNEEKINALNSKQEELVKAEAEVERLKAEVAELEGSKTDEEVAAEEQAAKEEEYQAKLAALNAEYGK